MAWLAKDSAGIQIAQRDEPYLDDQLKAQLEADVLVKYPTREAATLPVLHALQHKHGWLPHQAIEEAAEFLDLPASQVLDTASFYDDFWLEPKGKHVIWICQSLSCELTGSVQLFEKLKEKLGVDIGQTTEDGRFTLKSVECLGSCGTSPCMLIDDVLHENVTPQGVDQIIDAIEVTKADQ